MTEWRLAVTIHCNLSNFCHFYMKSLLISKAIHEEARLNGEKKNILDYARNKVNL